MTDIEPREHLRIYFEKTWYQAIRDRTDPVDKLRRDWEEIAPGNLDLVPKYYEEDEGLIYNVRTPYGLFSYDTTTFIAESPLRGRIDDLTPTEHAFLRALLRDAPKPVPFRKIMKTIRGETNYGFDVNMQDVLKAHIHRLRGKIGDTQKDDDFALIQNVRGIAYRFNGEKTSS